MRKWIPLLILATAFSTMSWSGEPARKVLILYDEKPQMDVLAKPLAAEGYEVDWTSTKEKLRPLDAYYAVIVFVHSTFPAEQADAVIAYTKAGGRMIALHHSISSGKLKTPQWLKFLGIELRVKKPLEEGGYTYQHDVDLRLVNLAPDHYITSNKIQYTERAEYKSESGDAAAKEYDCLTFPMSEVFINHTFTDGKEKTILYGYICRTPKLANDKTWMQERGGWMKKAEKGWIFYFMPGHMVKDLEVPAYQQIVLNCLTWKP